MERAFETLKRDRRLHVVSEDTDEVDDDDDVELPSSRRGVVGALQCSTTDWLKLLIYGRPFRRPPATGV